MILTQARVPYDVTAREWKDGGFRDSYAWHKRIWEAFPDLSSEAKRDFLTRLDDTGESFRLLILSPQPPTRPDWCPSADWRSKTIDDSFFRHQRYRFSLLVNPTRKKVVRDAAGNRKKNGQRHPITRREDLVSWLQRKALQHGFQIQEPQTLKTIPRPRRHFVKKGGGGTHGATEFVGILNVTNQAVFQDAACKGIGTAKAFGFGMICLDPLQ
jgi:CRISPR system Cascade subunit CasE